MTVELLSINTGVVAPLVVSDPEDPKGLSRELSAIRKQSISHMKQTDRPRLIVCNPLGIEGDEQADHAVHGGLEKAVYCYPFEHYQIWKHEVPWLEALADEDLFGLVGENLTLRGISEDQIFIADQIQIGQGVVLQVTKAREPCFKFNARMKSKHAAKCMVQKDICGWYCRVLCAGKIAAGDSVSVIAGAREMSVAKQNRWLAGK